MRFTFFISSLLFLYGATTLACPSPRLLKAIMVGNKSMQHKSVTLSPGVTWGIIYTYSIHGLSSNHWGVYGDYHELDPDQIPTIELENTIDSVPLSSIIQNASPHIFRKFCNYSATKPLSWSPSADGDPTFWKFSLYLDMEEPETIRPNG